MLLLIQKYIKKNRFAQRLPMQSMHQSENKKNQINHYNKQRRVLMSNSTVCQSKWKPIVEPRRAKPKTYRQAPTHWLKVYEEAVTESEARTAVVNSDDKTAIQDARDWAQQCCLIHDLHSIICRTILLRRHPSKSFFFLSFFLSSFLPSTLHKRSKLATFCHDFM